MAFAGHENENEGVVRFVSNLVHRMILDVIVGMFTGVLWTLTHLGCFDSINR